MVTPLNVKEEIHIDKDNSLVIAEHSANKGMILVNPKDATFADQVIEARRKKGPWDTGGVVEMIAQEWARRYPEEVADILYNAKLDRDNLKDAKFGETNNSDGMERRYVALMPQFMQNALRAIYDSTELPFDRKFWNNFRKKFPKLAISKKT